MCGIAVLMPKSNLERPQSEVLHHMLQRLEHRGPDGPGVWMGDRVGLGMRRLTIVGGDAGQQPIWNEDYTAAVVCNGEIYNYKELRRGLEAAGHKFRGLSDAEVIVHLYEAHGEDCAELLDGIYAFALWDEAKQKLMVVRDRVGVKPLYFVETAREFVMASEIGSLFANPEVVPELGAVGLAMFHAFRFVPGAHTVLEDVHKLPPGHLLTVRSGKLHVRAYWKPPIMLPPQGASRRKNNRRILNTQDAKGHTATVRELLVQAVTSQMAPEVKSSVLLSGGLDSTALLALLTNAAAAPQNTLTVGFERPRQFAKQREYSELDQAEQIANVFQASHQSELISAEEVLDKLPQIIADLDEPVADPTAIPLWFVSRLAKKTGNRVVFSGEGLDELFNGYDVYRQVRWHDKLQKVPHFLRLRALALFTKLGLPGQGALRRSLQPLWTWYQGVGGTFSQAEQRDLFHPALLHELLNIDIQDFVRGFIHSASLGSQLAQMTYFDVFAWLPENTLVKSDKISMAHSLELRVPFLDKKLVEYALRLPDDVKLRGKTGKWIIRQAVGQYVPEEVLTRRKAGFPVPISAWMFTEWRDFVLSTLLQPGAVTRDLYRSAQIEKLFRVEEQHRRRAARQLWSLLVMEIWYRQTLEKAVGVAQLSPGKLQMPANV